MSFDPFGEAAPNRYECMSAAEIIGEALIRLDGVTLTPQQAQEILDYRLYMKAWILKDDTIEPDEFVSDEEFALSEIAQGREERSFGEIYRKYHVSSEGQPLMEGIRETGLANDLASGSIWSEIKLWRLATRNQVDD